MEEDQTQAQPPDPNSPSHSSERSEPVRSRWTPKPEQILILESIFNSGMVNPPKDETVRIRKLLEKFGPVGDANVFYWFQNRRSRSRRRQRQLQAQAQASYGNSNTATGAIQFENGCGAPAASAAMGLLPATSCSPPAAFGSSPSPSFLVGSPSSSTSCGSDNGAESLFPMPAQVGFQQIGESSSILCPTGGSQNLQYQSDSITVFINGVATAVPRGPIDIKAAFGEDVMLVHSSGFPLPMNDFGCLLHSLQHGESYFLVSRAS